MPARRSGREVELVVTIPEPFGAELANQFGLRTTLGVLTELLASAERHVIMGAPFIQGEEGLQSEPLATALSAALKRGVRIDLISTGATFAQLHLDALRRVGEDRLRAYRPQKNAENARSLGSHAKFCLTDGELAYLGSANFTQMGIGGHLEIGVLLHGAVARKTWRFVTRLFKGDYLVEAPFA
jgi:phosphatidylserine/phosphatidylglycerophosphate/cardiolipin synthase-like enzyme